jgi:ABC-type transport system involved in multi-copper enzyme maturation permease subunit
MKTLRQIQAIARTEFRFGLRRGAPVVTSILIGLIFGAAILMTPLDNLPIARDEINQVLQDPQRIARLAQNGLTVDRYRQISSEGIASITVLSLPLAWVILLTTCFLFLPVASAISLPADRRFGVAELIHSLPVGGGTYLAGKFLGLLSTVLLAGLIPFVVSFAVFEAAYLNNLHAGLPGEVVWFFIKFALLDGVPLVAWALMLGILAGTPFRTQRAAILPGLVMGILGIFIYLVIFKAPSIPLGVLDLNTYYLVQNYHSPALEALVRSTGQEMPPMLGVNGPPLSIGRVILMDLVLLASLFTLAGLSRLWLYWKENF